MRGGNSDVGSLDCAPHWKRLVSAPILIAASLAMALGSAGATKSAFNERDDAGSLREYIQQYLSSHGDDPSVELAAKVAVVRVHLSVRDPTGYIAYVTSGGWCGSGGCHTLIVSNRDGRFQALGFIGATELPIAVQPPAGRGDAAIVVAVRDMEHGGATRAVLKREGDSYAPRIHERPAAEALRAMVVVPKDAAAVPLY